MSLRERARRAAERAGEIACDARDLFALLREDREAAVVVTLVLVTFAGSLAAAAVAFGGSR